MKGRRGIQTEGCGKLNANGNKNINTREWEWELTSGNGRE